MTAHTYGQIFSLFSVVEQNLLGILVEMVAKSWAEGHAARKVMVYKKYLKENFTYTVYT